MRKVKTRDEKFWDYLSNKIGNTKSAKEVFNKVMKTYCSKPKTIDIKFNVDTSQLMKATKIAETLTGHLSKIRISK